MRAPLLPARAAIHYYGVRRQMTPDAARPCEMGQLYIDTFPLALCFTEMRERDSRANTLRLAQQHDADARGFRHAIVDEIPRSLSRGEIPAFTYAASYSAIFFLLARRAHCCDMRRWLDGACGARRRRK